MSIPNERVTKLESKLSLDSDYNSSGEESNLLSNRQKLEDAGQPKQKYPKSVFFIIGNEFCERFSFYGLRTVLFLYFSQTLLYSPDTATALYHSFVMIAYFTPVLGAIIADSWLGKFKTILYLSILYAIGCIILAAGSFPNGLTIMNILSLLGLVTIAFGTGGIKPCVSAFGGDQFKEGQEKQQQQFFSLFYLSINLGSVISTIAAPMLREDVKCLGQSTCFPLAFGVPAILMIIAIVFFVCGKALYIMKPPAGNIMVDVIKCIGYAIGKKCKCTGKGTQKKKSHWLDHADDKYDKELIGDIKTLIQVLKLYIPLPIFWCLFDQSGSRWTQQATKLNGDFFGVYYIKADQMQSVNPLLIVIFIPLFEYCIYPILNKFRLLRKPLQRITAGGVLAAVAFICAGLLQLQIESNESSPLSPGHSELTIINNSPCSIKFEGMEKNTYTESITAFDNAVFEEMPNDVYTWKFTPSGCAATEPFEFTFNASSQMSSIMITTDKNALKVLETQENKTKAKTGEPQVKIYHNIEITDIANASFKLVGKENYNIGISENAIGMTNYTAVTPGRYKVYAPADSKTLHSSPIAEISTHSGGIYIVSVYNVSSDPVGVKAATSVIVKGNSVSILYQIPQYIIITAGEILLSITGLEFSYSQAPPSMKSVVQAAWLITVAFGNLIVMIIAESKLFDILSHELFFFAALMLVDMMIFAILAFFYKYVNAEKYSSEERPPDKGVSNNGYVEETDFNK